MNIDKMNRKEYLHSLDIAKKNPERESSKEILRIEKEGEQALLDFEYWIYG